MTKMPPRILSYLKQRGLSDAVIEDSGLGWTGSHISIPIRNPQNALVFHKYRKDPENIDKAFPKYIYDSGSTCVLYNSHKLKNADTVYVVEGELDALRLESEGKVAVSSTGGSGTFREDWKHLFKDVKDIIICYDNDEAGMKGALNVHNFLPEDKVRWLPEFDGKDVTDYLNKFNFDNFDKLNCKSYIVPNDYEEQFTKKKELVNLIDEYKKLADYYLDEQRELKRTKENWKHTQVLIDMLLKRVENLKSKLVYFDTKNSEEYVTQIDAAKQVPLTNYIHVNYSNMVKCPWHDDNSPSMKYYHQGNYLFCFGGCGRKDIIDLVQFLEKVDFKEAVKRLTR